MKENIISGELKQKISEHLLESLEHPSNKNSKNMLIEYFTDEKTRETVRLGASAIYVRASNH